MSRQDVDWRKGHQPVSRDELEKTDGNHRGDTYRGELSPKHDGNPVAIYTNVGAGGKRRVSHCEQSFFSNQSEAAPEGI